MPETRRAVAESRIREVAELADSLRATYRERPVRGTFVIELPVQGAIRALALAGFDFLVLDLEHSPLDLGGLAPLIAQAHLTDTPTLVRPWSRDPGLIGRILDLGADGLLVPHVETAGEAAAVVSAARYPPAGARGVCPLVATTALDDPVAKLRDSVIVLVQIEGLSGIANVEEIAAVPGVDGVFVGPHDLSHALGVPGEVDGGQVAAAAARVAEAVPEGMMLGAYVDDPEGAQAWTERGFGLQCLSFDARMLLDSASDALGQATERTTRAR